MAYKLKSLKKLNRGGKLLGAKVVCEDPEQLVEDEKGNMVPLKEIREYGAGNLKFRDNSLKVIDAKKKPANFEAAFKKMLLGEGTVAKPKGEIGLLLDELNKVSPSIEESDL